MAIAAVTVTPVSLTALPRNHPQLHHRLLGERHALCAVARAAFRERQLGGCAGSDGNGIGLDTREAGGAKLTVRSPAAPLISDS